MAHFNKNSEFLHLGCGTNAPANWLNVDGSPQVWFAHHPYIKGLCKFLRIYPKSQGEIDWPKNILRADLRKNLPFPDARFISVYSSHTFEHLYRDDAVRLAKECFRVLKRGGVCRVVVPDLRHFINCYLQRCSLARSDGFDNEPADEFMENMLVHPRGVGRGFIGLYHRMTALHQHKWMYDANSLCKLLADAGFTNVREERFQSGAMIGVREIEEQSRVLDGAGVVAEGVK